MKHRQQLKKSTSIPWKTPDPDTDPIVAETKLNRNTPLVRELIGKAHLLRSVILKGALHMTNILGIDIAKSSFTFSVSNITDKTTSSPLTHSNDQEGFEKLTKWLQHQNLSPNSITICLEDTGVYAEALCYWFAAKEFPIAVEPPNKVKRAFQNPAIKSDALDSRQIAEYGFRFFDQLSYWKPLEPVLEQMKVLLSTREQFVEQLTAQKNSLQMITLKVVKTPLAETAIQETIEHFKEQIKKIDNVVKDLISKDPSLGQTSALLTSIPGVGVLLASNLLVLTKGFHQPIDPRRLASHVGICPHPFESGSSIHRRPRSRHYGPPRVRKLLYLAAMSMRTHNPTFKAYFLRKVQAGKSKKLVLNNISNKMLHIICAIVNSQKPFISNYKSVNPRLLCA